MKVYGIPLDEVAEINDEIETESHTRYELHTIQKVESQPLKILTDEEAIMKMELSHAPVMVYRDEKDRRLKVIWRLENGNYGVIEPEQC
jgi:putative sigma-54 modulation protein